MCMFGVLARRSVCLSVCLSVPPTVYHSVLRRTPLLSLTRHLGVGGCDDGRGDGVIHRHGSRFPRRAGGRPAGLMEGQPACLPACLPANERERELTELAN